MTRSRKVVAASAILIGVAALLSTRPLPEAVATRPASPAASSFTLFESGQVRPLALSPNGRLLFACNTPDNRLEVLRVSSRGLRPLGSIAVGLEPVAVAARTDREVWVVNHLSDSVSIVRLDDDLDDGDDRDDDHHGRGRRPSPGWVAQTLLVGDEPRDIVFAGRHHRRAFVTTAHRGQNAGFDPQLLTPGIGRADVWVFDAEHPGGGLGGTPVTRLTLFTDTPRALAATPDGSRVYAAGFLTGNRTTTIFESIVTAHGGTPAPHENFEHIAQPPTGLIVKFDGAHWTDELGRTWDDQVKFSLPDKDVFVIDANANPPVATTAISGVGTVLFNMAVNPANGRVYVTNTDALNDKRFEGPGTTAGHTVRGHLAESHITVIGPGVSPRHLNKHINYADCCNPNPSDENRRSLAFPTDLQVTRDGSTLYVAAFGSSKVGVFSTAALEADTFTPDASDHIEVSGGGPSGLALDEHHRRLYVLTRFNNSIAIVDTHRKREIGSVALHNPEPAHVVSGRRFLYDASFSSAHGDTACASCHIFGDFDGLAWDLGNPDASEIANNGILTVPSEPFGVTRNFRPMKGPMTTQSLRGMANHGAMHWRGDRLNNSEPSAQPDDGAFDEDTAFKKFNVAFEGLNGRSAQITDAEMDAFTRFVLEITYPPNPIRALDDSLAADEQAGKDLFMNPARKTDSFFECNGCHVLKPDGNAEFGVSKPGFFGTDGRFSFENEPQVFKIPHLRNQYQKVGMFGMAKAPFFLPESPDPAVDNAFTGDQVRGFGFLHDGSCDTLFRFHSTVVFLQRPPGFLSPRDPGNPTGIPASPAGFLERRNLAKFMLAFDSNLKPIVGQQVTFTGDNSADALPRLQLMMARADAGDCQLIAKRGGRGYLYVGTGKFRPDRSTEALVPDAALRALSKLRFGEVTFTCVPPGSGYRIGIDRDGDGTLDGDE